MAGCTHIALCLSCLSACVLSTLLHIHGLYVVTMVTVKQVKCTCTVLVWCIYLCKLGFEFEGMSTVLEIVARDRKKETRWFQ